MMEIDGESTGFPTTLLTTEDTIRQDISWTEAQPSLVVPDNAPPPKLRTEAAAQSVNIDGSGLRIRIPVLKRQREKE